MHWKPGPRVKSIGAWLGDHILGALVGFVVVAVVTLLIATLSGGGTTGLPSLAAQWEQVRADLREEGWEVTADERVEMRGNTQPVTFLALRRDGECTGVAAAPSDQVRIYEVNAGKLRRTFMFQPDATGCKAWAFHLARTADLSGSGRKAVFGEFDGNPLGEPGEMIPVVIAWNERDRHYIASPLITEPPESWLYAKRFEGHHDWFQKHEAEMFRRPIRLTADARDGAAYGATELHFAFRGTEDSYLYGIFRLTSGIPLGGRAAGPASSFHPIMYQRTMWHLEPSKEGVVAGWCQLPRPRMAAFVSLMNESKVLDKLVQHGQAWFEFCNAPSFH